MQIRGDSDEGQIEVLFIDRERLDAESGTVTFDGYDPASTTLCGTVEATFSGELGRVVATFSAKGFCKYVSP